MKAPDKLYVSQLIYETWQFQTPDPDDETQVEYIRKELLLEWVNAMGKCSPSVALLADELIRKINSL